MKKAFKTPYIGTRAELKRESIRNLKKLVAYLNWYKGRAVICKNMITKLLGICKSWNWLDKQGLIDILIAWKNLANRWKRSSYDIKQVGSEVHIIKGKTIYKRYIPADKLWQARIIAADTSGLWMAIRKAKRCIGWKWEVECWWPDSQEDLFATTIHTRSGSFTEKKSPQNPFVNVTGFVTTEKVLTNKAVIERKEDEEAAEAYQDIFGTLPTAAIKCHNPWPEKTLDKKQFVEDSISEAYKFTDKANWTITLINRSMEDNDTSIRIVQNKVIFWIETGKIIPSFRGTRKPIKNLFPPGTNLFPDTKETFKISNKPGKGWFKEHTSGVFDTDRKYYQTLEELAEAELGYEEIPF